MSQTSWGLSGRGDCVHRDADVAHLVVAAVLSDRFVDRVLVAFGGQLDEEVAALILNISGNRLL